MDSIIAIPHQHGVTSLDLHQFTSSEREEILFAFCFAQRVHNGQYRKTGEPFITHPVEVANILLNELWPQLGISITKEEVITALIHDSIEDSDLDITAIKILFGETVAHLINLLTKKWLYLYFDQLTREVYDQLDLSEQKRYLQVLKPQLKPLQLLDYYQWISTDPRAVRIKRADKRHNHSTLHIMGEEKMKEELNETKVYFNKLINESILY